MNIFDVACENCGHDYFNHYIMCVDGTDGKEARRGCHKCDEIEDQDCEKFVAPGS